PDMPADISDKLSFLRSFGAVSLTEEQRNAAAKLAGTFKEYRSRISSAVKINEKGEALSTAWEKLSFLRSFGAVSLMEEQRVIFCKI
ncbi:MAG: hypothetical protein ACI4SJ_03435, partial [Candidatus Avispirillum sp.]